jgi:protease PrsW
MLSSQFAIALLSGLIPVLFWLWFWLREDSRKPEPYLLITISFIAGMAVVPLAVPLQELALGIYQNSNTLLQSIANFFPSQQGIINHLIKTSVFGTDLVIVWVIIEELLKYAVALILIFWNREVDEPIDMIVYLIVIALGFAALENALFINQPLTNQLYLDSALTGTYRFLGATLLHVLASGTIGAFLAFSYYQSKTKQLIAGTFGLFMAVVLHTLFNFFIMGTSGETILFVFLFVWLGVIVLFLIFEKVKIIEYNHNLLHKK